MRFRKMRGIISAAALLLALTIPSAANGQSDNFFYIDDESEYRGGDNTGGTGSWLDLGENTGGEVSWVGFEEGNPLPTGTGLLLLTLSGACYGAAQVKRGARNVKRVVRRD